MNYLEKLPFNVNEKPEGMSDKEWMVIDTMFSVPMKVERLKAFYRQQEKVIPPSTPKEHKQVTKAQRQPIGFIAKEFLLFSLPARRPKENYWLRKNGNKSFLIQGGVSIDQKGKPYHAGVPYGATAKLIIAYLFTAAKYSPTNRILLGSSFDAFLKAIGSSPERRGKKTGAEASLRQLEAICSCTFRTFENLSKEDEENIYSGLLEHAPRNITAGREIWFSKKKGAGPQQTLFDSYIDIDPELYKSIKNSPVPFDWEVLIDIRNDPTAIDLYFIATYEAARAMSTGKDRFIPYKSLGEQLGLGSYEAKKFGAIIRAKFKKIQKSYKGLEVTFPRGGFVITTQSTPSIPMKSATK